MIVKNIGRKIIGFGQVSVLPGQTLEIDDSYKTNPVVTSFKALGLLEVVEKEAPKEQKNKTDKKNSSAKGKKSEEQTEDEKDESEQPEDKTDE